MIRVEVVDLEEQSHFLQVNPHDTVKHFRETLERVLKKKLENIMLRTSSKYIYDGKLSDFNVNQNSRIKMHIGVFGGGDIGVDMLGIEFPDISDKSKAVEVNFSNTAPDYYSASPGLCLEGTCTTKECVAYDKTVIINKEMGKYNLIEDEDKNYCPKCNKYVQTTVCAFNRCWYSYSGKMKEPGLPSKKVEGKEEKVGHCYRRFRSDKDKPVRWVSLEIITRKL